MPPKKTISKITSKITNAQPKQPGEPKPLALLQPHKGLKKRSLPDSYPGATIPHQTPQGPTTHIKKENKVLR